MFNVRENNVFTIRSKFSARSNQQVGVMLNSSMSVHQKLSSLSAPVFTGRMTNKPTANQSNTKKEKEKEQEKEETLKDDSTELAFKDAGHCSRNTHNLLLGLTVLGTELGFYL